MWANFRSMLWISPSTEQLACPKKPVSPRFNAAWKPNGNIFPSVESFYGSLVLLCGTKSHNDLSTVTGSYLILGTRVVLRASSMFIKVQLTRRIAFFQLLYSFGLYTEVKRSTEKITLRNSLSIVTFTAWS